jgi:hypothetical protein
MIQNLIVITSVINIPDLPFSYTTTRSVYNKNERFEQTKNTIKSIRDKIPDSKILLVECSELNDEETEYIKNHVEYFINIYGTEHNFEKHVFGLSKSMGENTLILQALEYLKLNNITYENFYKISGRYWLTDNFNYENFNHDKIAYSCTLAGDNDIFTSFYKLNSKHINSYIEFIKNNQHLLINYVDAEIFFGMYVNTINENEKKKISFSGIAGKIACWNNYFLEY